MEDFTIHYVNGIKWRIHFLRWIRIRVVLDLFWIRSKPDRITNTAYKLPAGQYFGKILNDPVQQPPPPPQYKANVSVIHLSVLFV